MKKTLYSIIVTVLFVSSLLSQSSVEINGADNYIDYASDTVYISGDGVNISEKFYVVNRGTTTQFYWARKIISKSNSDLEIELCDENLCMPTNGLYWISQSEKTIQPGDSLEIKPQMTLNGVSGTSEVRYYALDGNKEKIDSIAVMFTSTLSTEKEKQIDFSIFPNPAQDFVTVKGEGLKNGGVIVFLDALGKEVKRSSVKSTHASISVNDLRRGVYFVNIYGQNGVKGDIQRLIIQ